MAKEVKRSIRDICRSTIKTSFSIFGLEVPSYTLVDCAGGTWRSSEIAGIYEKAGVAILTKFNSPREDNAGSLGYSFPQSGYPKRLDLPIVVTCADLNLMMERRLVEEVGKYCRQMRVNHLVLFGTNQEFAAFFNGWDREICER